MSKLKLSQKNVHLGFEIGLILKGIDSLIEIISGILILFVTKDEITKFADFIQLVN